MKLILASNSPRRRALLGEAGIPFEVEPSRFREEGGGSEAEQVVLCYAEGKAREVFSRHPEAAVLGADTVVSFGGKIVGKPRDEEDAKRMLRLLSGNTHTVFSGVCLLADGVVKKGVSATRVTFFPLSEALIDEYVASGTPLDKAGAYGIQDGYEIVKSYEGSYTNVVGLPMELVEAFLKEVGIC